MTHSSPFTEENIIKLANSANPREHAFARRRNEEYIADLEGRLGKAVAENKRLREALENILHGVSTGAITSEYDETFANAVRKARQSLNGDEG